MLLRTVFLLAGFWLAAAVARADDASQLDWSAWQRMPVFDKGRLMPLDTFARSVVSAICGRENPRLDLQGALPGEDVDSAAFAQARKLFPTGKPRKFTSAELLFSWLVEPEKWEQVPLLAGGHWKLRRDVLGLPVKSGQGRRLKYVSVRQVESAPRLHRRLAELSEKQAEAEAEGLPFQPVGVDKKLSELVHAYRLYRMVSFNPAAADADRRRFRSKLTKTVHSWSRTARQGKLVKQELGQLPQPDAATDPEGAGGADEQKPGQEKAAAAEFSRAAEAMQRLVELYDKGDLKLDEMEPAVAAFRRCADSLARRFADGRTRVLQAPADGDQRRLDRLRTALGVLSVQTAALAEQATQMHLALYDGGRSLRIVPALNPAALEDGRDPSDDAQPWLGLQALILGSDDLLADYPQREVQKVRQTYAQVASVYVDRDDPNRKERFALAMERFAAAVRSLGQAIEPLRNRLPIRQRDEALFAATAYPPSNHTSAELHYNRLDPFFWSWVVSLGSVACFALSFGRLRMPIFWLGIVVLAAGQLFTIYGFALRAYITGWVPVANMFETVVFVGLTVSMLGLWFALLPLLWPGCNSAWRLTGVPPTWKPGRFRREPGGTSDRQGWSPARLLILVARLALVVLVFLVLAVWPWGSGGLGTIISPWPRTSLGSSIPTAGNLLIWMVGWCVLLWTMWFVPRLMLTGVLSVVTIPRGFAGGLAQPLAQVATRKPFAVVGAVVACFFAILAWFAPMDVWNKDISSLRPVLRDNFWLLCHVLTITASYGAGALAWGLGNIALGHYLFGRYRNGAEGRQSTAADSRRPTDSHRASPGAVLRRDPQPCAALANFTYKSIQVATWLLAAGTFLGAMWADVAWGRFWSWDAKEVWALVSLLAYMVILHGRRARWFGNFGLAVGAVLGATTILMAWYGVNFVLGSGLHTYGGGAGGKLQVGIVVLSNWLFAAAAAIRYRIETSATRPADASPPSRSAAIET